MRARFCLIGLLSACSPAVVFVAVDGCSSSSDDTTTGIDAAADASDASTAADTASVVDAPGADTAATDSGGGESGITDAGFGHYMGPCNATPDCPDGGVCFDFPQFGKYCTLACGGGDGGDCPPPSPHCSPAFVCALPR